MSNTDQVPEPSMEEILSSIRRIISDDGDAPEAEAAVADAPAPEPVAEDPMAAAMEEDPMAAAMEEDPMAAAMEEDPMAAAMAEEAAEDDEDVFELTNIITEEPVSSDDADMDEFGSEVADSGADVADDIGFVEVESDNTPEPEMDMAPEPVPEPAPAPVVAVQAPADPFSALEAAVPVEKLVSNSTSTAASASFDHFANAFLSRGEGSTVEELVQEMLRPMLKGWLDTNLPVLVEKLVSEEIERIARRGR